MIGIILFIIFINVFADCNDDVCVDNKVNNDYQKIIEKIDGINDRLDIMIKYRHMNRTDDEIYQDAKNAFLMIGSLFLLIIILMLTCGAMVIWCD